MAAYHEPKNIGDLLLVEVKPGWTRDRGAFAQGPALVALGAVLDLRDGKYLPFDPAAAKARACAVAAETVDVTQGERPGVVIARGAAVALDALVWPAGITDVQKAAALAQLAAQGIVAREQV